MSRFMILLKKNLIEMVRNKRIIVFSCVFVALAVISAVTAKFLPVLIDFLLGGMEETIGDSLVILKSSVADSYVQFISNFGQIAVFLIAILFVSAIVKEKSKGTYNSLKMNGVKDNEIVLSHLISQIIVVTLSFLISVAIFILLNILLFRQIMGVRGLVALIYIYLLMLATISFSLFISCLCKSTGKAYLFVILSYFLLTILEIIPRINRFNPLHLITLATNLMYYEQYSVKSHLMTSLSCFGMCVILVLFSLLLVKNRINNKREITNDRTERI